jgi:signal transduction histidine kinase
MCPLDAERRSNHRRIALKSSDDSAKSVYLPDHRHSRESKIANRGNSSSAKFLLSEKDAGRHRGGLEETIGEEDEFNKLLQMGRHLAHELNNLLTTILANTQLMFLVVKDEELKPYLEALEDAARDAGTIVREFQGSVKELTELSSQEKENHGDTETRRRTAPVKQY